LRALSASLYNESLGTEPRQGPRAEPLIRVMAKPLEAEGTFVFQKCKRGANFSFLFSCKLLKYTFGKNIVAFLFGDILFVVTL